MHDADLNDSQDEVHYLEIQGSELEAEVFAVQPRGVKIGRTAPAEIVLPHKSVSREHCMVGVANDELIVTDLNSTNGTFIDGIAIEDAYVHGGEQIRIGASVLAVERRVEALDDLGAHSS